MLPRDGDAAYDEALAPPLALPLAAGTPEKSIMLLSSSVISTSGSGGSKNSTSSHKCGNNMDIMSSSLYGIATSAKKHPASIQTTKQPASQPARPARWSASTSHPAPAHAKGHQSPEPLPQPVIVVKEGAHLKMKSPFCCFFAGASTIEFSPSGGAMTVVSTVPRARSAVYSDKPWRTARSKIFLSTVSAASHH